MPLYSAENPSSKKSVPLYYALIFAVTFLAFHPALRNELTFDDIKQVHDIAVPSTTSGWLHSVAAPWWPPSNPHTLWRPIPRISILFQKAIHPGQIWPFYAFNIFLLALTGCLLFAVARELKLSSTAAILAALLFVAHPLHSEI